MLLTTFPQTKSSLLELFAGLTGLPINVDRGISLDLLKKQHSAQKVNVYALNNLEDGEQEEQEQEVVEDVAKVLINFKDDNTAHSAEFASYFASIFHVTFLKFLWLCATPTLGPKICLLFFCDGSQVVLVAVHC